MHDFNDEELLTLWKKEGISKRRFAKKYGWNYNTLKSRLYRMKKKKQVFGRSKTIADGNYLYAESNSPRIKTLEQLIEVCEIDLEEWVIERHVINKWEVGAKVEKKDLTWIDGIITEGKVTSPGKLTVEPLFQVKATLVKRKPEAIDPVISPIKYYLPKFELPTEPLKKILTKTLVVSDPHFGFARDFQTGKLTPFHDQGALNTVLSLAKEVDEIIIAGDILDLAEWSDKFVKSPEMYWTTQEAINACGSWLASLKLVNPRLKIKILRGNHDKRLELFIVKHANAASRFIFSLHEWRIKKKVIQL